MKTFSSTVISQFLVVKEHGQLPESASIMLSPVYLLLHKIAIFAFLSNLAEGGQNLGPRMENRRSCWDSAFVTQARLLPRRILLSTPGKLATQEQQNEKQR